MKQEEIWIPIHGYEDLYEVSNFGNVRSVDRVVCQRHWQGGTAVHIYKGKRIKLRHTINGYLTADLHANGSFKRCLVHRLVAEHFHTKPDGKDYINHLDNDPTNNHADNLVWCTQAENIQYAYDNGTKTPPHEKTVIQYSMDGTPLKTWKSVAHAERSLNINNVAAVCRGIRNHAGGYKWQYA